MLSLAREIQRAKQNGQVSLFGVQSGATLASFKLPEVVPASQRECLSWEKELLGLYVSQHPLRDYQSQLTKSAFPCQKLSKKQLGRRVQVGGIVNKIQKVNTRAGQPMLFVEIEDLTGRIETLVFPNVLEETATAWQEEKIVLVSGRLSDRDGSLKILCDSVKVLK